MLALDDPLWETLEGGYRRPCAAHRFIERLERDGDEGSFWEEFVGELYHQEDVGVASYAVIPHLVRIFADRPRSGDFYAYIAWVDAVRGQHGNPELPDWLVEDYREALRRALFFIPEDLPRLERSGDRMAIVQFVVQQAGFIERLYLLESIESEEHAREVLQTMTEF